MSSTIFDVSQAPTNQPNILDNAGFEIWQRGNTFTNPANGAYLADRWALSSAGTAPTATVTKETSTIDSGIAALKWNITSNTGNTQAYIYQTVEAYQAYQGKTITISIRINSSASGNVLAIYDGVTVTSTAIPSNAGYTTYSVTKAISSSATIVQVFFGNNSGQVSTGTFYLDSAMLVIGPNPASFISLHPAIDLARCQRYYETGTIASVNLPIANITAVRTEIDFAWNFAVTKRVAPTVTMTTTQSTQVQLAPGAFGTVTDSTSSWPSTAGSTTVDSFTITANRGSNTTYPTLQYSATWVASADL